ncbi:sensor histidine kinase [Terriglobus saanensis]|uniref:histidine kinase n=1 Tax=Terriglobus saanensis (strain ATCC BAA-1853 / DSM 23119 / SP1PR4) TaxID=401053 RepID=E8V8I4_TERSS|nr:ATP-binding protein [Terriglobus saanensis]ADV82963.1 integral membrane sensor signal transduction histidine kinase [Terriglobus saanensis SP1PR4]
MNSTRRRGAIAFFLTLGVCLVATAVVLQFGWIIVNGKRFPVLLVLGIVLFILMIAGMIINTIFLVREIRRNERQDSFLNSVTHELKTPIASIQLSLETLQQRPMSEDQRQGFYGMMMEDNARLLATVEQILRAGDASHRKSARHRLPVDLRALTLECLNDIARRHQLRPEAVRMEDRAQGAAVIVAGDVEDLRSALMNVLENAVKYSPVGVRIIAELDLARDGRVSLKINDSGVGIPAAMLKRVFHRFYRVTGRDSVNVKGTGLGLFIVRSVMRQHGGDATAQSFGPGKGTTISLWLPSTGQHGEKA